MEKDTDSKGFKLDTNGVLPYQEDVIDLCQKLSSLAEDDENTVAYARLSEEAIEVLAAAGEAPYVSIVPDGFEYKLADFDEGESLDDPLKNLGDTIGSTRFFTVLEGLGRMGMSIYPPFSKEEQAKIVYELDDLENGQLAAGELPKALEKLVLVAVDQGVPREEVEKLLDSSAQKRGVLVGLSKQFLQDAGEDVWPEQNRGENNHPSRYAHLKSGLKLDYITKIIPLDDTSEVILDELKEHAGKYQKELEARIKLRQTSVSIRSGVEDLGLNV
jgi:hypothetical protein